MSGLLCVFDPEGIPQDAPRYLAALRRMAHRGPDGEGSCLRPQVFLGHRRRSRGSGQDEAQPLQSADGRVAIVLDGRLTSERPAGQSDAALVLDAYLRHGPDCFERLEGCWAVILWDSRSGQLLLSRDRLGLRPLYKFRGDRLIVASEIKAILALDADARAPDRRRILRYLPRGTIDDWTGTFFARVQPVEPGSVVTAARGRCVGRRFWTLAPATDRSLRPQAVLELLGETIARDTPRGVPVGLALSGGVDSGVIAGLVAREAAGGDRQVHAFSIRPPRTPDESAGVAATVRACGLAHTQVPLDRVDYARAVDRLLDAQDEPVQTAGNLYQFLLREQMAAAGCRAVLVGHGADEIFAGYEFMAAPFLGALLSRGRLGDGLRFAIGARGFLAAHPLRILAMGMRQRLPAPRDDGLAGVADLLAEPADPGPPDQDLHFLDLARLGPGREFFATLLDCFRAHVPLFVRVEDRNAAANGMELVAPFLDHRVVEMALAFPFHEYMRGGLNKAILRRAAAAVVAPEVLAQQHKYYTPGNSAYVAFEALRPEFLAMFDAPAFAAWGLWAHDCRERYLADAARPRRADVWLRIFMTQRWWERAQAGLPA